MANHVSPPVVDDAFSSWVFDRFLDELDPEHLIFLKGEVEALAQYRLTVDSEFQGQGWSFIPALQPIYRNALGRTISVVDGLTAHKVLATSGYLTHDSTWADTAEELKGRIRARLKAEVVERLAFMRRGSPDAGESEFIETKSASALTAAKAFVLRNLRRALVAPADMERNLSERYLGTIARAFDPHSAYLSATDIEDFVSSLSNEGYFFGFSLGENERGEIVIEHLIPGGSAWRSGLLNTGDVIIGLQWAGRERVDVRGATLDEVDEILNEDNHAELLLEVAKVSGATERVALRKERMKNEENIVKSVILEAATKVGYISLPGFYTDWGDEDGARCANDVAREILKLKKEDVTALILDLRNNGGGSLLEAVAMVGIFVDAGPVSVTRERRGETLLKDINRGMVFGGPLIVMVNGRSASASEFVAAALQDHNRAIIVGSRTFGKSTGQALLPLEQDATQGGVAKAGLSYAKVTVQKIYRVTGKTVQQAGVTPDIAIPDVYDSIPYREAVLSRSLPMDSTTKKTWFRPLSPLPVDTLRHLSEARVAGDKRFDSVRKLAGLIASSGDDDRISLDAREHFQNAAPVYQLLQALDSAGDSQFTVTHHPFDAQRMEIDDYLQRANAAWRERLVGDMQLGEAFRIANDYIELQKNRD